MKATEVDKFFTEEAYFLLEEESELKHELINGELIEMSGVSIFHNDIVGNIYLLLRNLIRGKNLKVVFENYKIKTPEGNFFYPDVAVCLPGVQKYFSEHPILIIEVLSDATRKYDLTDKFIQYQKIETLQYYICAEPEQQVVVFYQKQENGSWTAETFTKDEQHLVLNQLSISISLKDIYTS